MLEDKRTLNEPAVEVIWRLRAENVISVEDYEVLRDALYKLAGLEENEESENVIKGGWNFFISPKNWFAKRFKRNFSEDGE